MNDKFWLEQAESLLWVSAGKTAPNPAVAAIIVKDNKVLAQGIHTKAGDAHAEQQALANCADPAGATLYVTLEPCNHYGSTPACSDLIIKSGIARVIFGCPDLNPNVAGLGAKKINASGIACINLSSKYCHSFYQAFFSWAKHKKSVLLLKIAVDSAMQMADNSGKPIAITSKPMNQRVAHWRAFHDAIITTDTNVLNDNPRLNARLENSTEKKPLIIIARNDVFELKQNIFQTAKEIYIILPEKTKLKPEIKTKVTVITFKGEYADWEFILQTCACLGFHRVWAEVGSKTTKYLLENKIPDDIIIIRSKRTFPSSCYNIKNAKIAPYPINQKYQITEDDSIQHIGTTDYPKLIIEKERQCLPES